MKKYQGSYPNNQPVFNVNGNLTYENKCAYVDDDWFNIFHYDFIKGNAASFAHNPYSIILTASAAKKYFGKRECNRNNYPYR
ncbi:MAG: ABC transporter permease [Segetibacter sp.]